MIRSLPSVAKIIFGVALVVLVGVNFFYGPQIGAERLPMQWDLHGQPTWFAPKVFSLWTLVAVTVLVGAVLVLVGRNRPSTGSLSVWWCLIFLSTVMVGAHAFHVFSILRWVDQ